MSLLYQGLALDQLGQPIYLGIFNQIAGDLPLQVLFVVSNQYTNGFGMHRQYTQVLDPDGTLMAQSDESQFLLQNVIGGQRIDERFGVQFSKEGRHTVRVFLNDQMVIEHFFMVRPRRMPPTPEA